jgi:integrase
VTQHATVHQELRRYSRTDFTALRAWVQRIPVGKVQELYYADEAPQVQQGLEQFLTAMRQDLIERSILANPRLADLLAKARMGGALSLGALNLLIQAADAQPSQPAPGDHVGQWLRSKVATQLTGAGITTLAQLTAYIETHGSTWWRPIPRIGALRARAIVQWLERTPNNAVDSRTQVTLTNVQNLSPLASTPLPLERIAALPSPLDGSQGINRAPVFCYLSAKNDLEAVQTYVQKFRQQPHTARAYQRELERFLLWAVLIRKKALSSLLVDDCEAYKRFLESPSPSFTGPRRGRFTPQWRPFVAAPSPESQKQAVQILRTAFGWLQAVRYLGGNPWVAVSDPRTDIQLHPIQIERALPPSLFEKTVQLLSDAAMAPQASQARIALAALLLLGDSGLRISEAASATVEALIPSNFTTGRYQLKVRGKRGKIRLVPLTPRTLAALQAHQADIDQRYGTGTSGSDSHPNPDQALIRPISLPHGDAAQALHLQTGRGYAPNALARVLTKALKAIAGLDSIGVEEMIKLRTTSAHGLRHTFGTSAIQDEMPLDVVQSILGHASLNTTSIYVQAQERRVAVEAERLLGRRAGE